MPLPFIPLRSGSVIAVLVQTAIPVNDPMLPAHVNLTGRWQAIVAVAMPETAARVTGAIARIDPTGSRKIDPPLMAKTAAVIMPGSVVAVMIITISVVIVIAVITRRDIAPVRIVVASIVAVIGNCRPHDRPKGEPGDEVAIVAAIAGNCGCSGDSGQRECASHEGGGDFAEHGCLPSQALGLVAVIVAVVGDGIGPRAPRDRAGLWTAGFMVLMLRAVLLVIVVLIAVLALAMWLVMVLRVAVVAEVLRMMLVVVFGRVAILLLVAVVARSIVPAAITVSIAITVIGNRSAKNGQCGHTGDDGGGLAPALCLRRCRGQAGDGQSRADDKRDELAMHGHSFRVVFGHFYASVRVTGRHDLKLGSVRQDRQ